MRNKPLSVARLFELAWAANPEHMLHEGTQLVEDGVQALLRAAAFQADPEEASRLRATALSWLTERHERLLITILHPREGELHAEKAEDVLIAQRTRPEQNRLIDALPGEEAAKWKSARDTTEELLQQIWSARWKTDR